MAFELKEVIEKVTTKSKYIIVKGAKGTKRKMSGGTKNVDN
jgi:hypothetical protein